MLKFIWVCAALMAMFVTGESLMCYTCKVGIAGKCLVSSTQTCNRSEESCSTMKLAFNISGFMSLQTQGCMASSLCNQTESGSFLTADYTITKTCCSTDLCNGATALQLQHKAALGAALMAVWSSWSL